MVIWFVKKYLRKKSYRIAGPGLTVRKWIAGKICGMIRFSRKTFALPVLNGPGPNKRSEDGFEVKLFYSALWPGREWSPDAFWNHWRKKSTWFNSIWKNGWLPGIRRKTLSWNGADNILPMRWSEKAIWIWKLSGTRSIHAAGNSMWTWNPPISQEHLPRRFSKRRRIG